ncbi:hypothetical protein [Speluncibacter jeojiensis]|uniref:Low molecular weight antigen MTB12-like C-terminal domain-containing protein n=1 Tax=Speluncibacter jeojiensis TaxID=2710754 RepID=A0A9X4LWI1_9ACTN|nr:hypothetical protein [Rhodococcus sp. D2-41]MDG3013464.1 hypothetical protein [Corynebacteriales bacterium D3-21]
MNFRKSAIAVLALGAALTMSACGSSDNNSSATHTTTAKATTSASAPSQFPPVPTVDQLNAELKTALDPSIPATQKEDLVQGAAQDPTLFDQIAQKASQTQGLAYKVVGPVIDQGDGTLQANFEVTLNGQTNPGTATFVAENGKWKLSKENACGIAAALGLKSAACPS